VRTGAVVLPRQDTIALDWNAVGFALLLTTVTLALFALLPAWRSARVDIVETLKDGSAASTAGARRQRLRGALVVAEVALAVILLTGAGLMLRSLWNLQRINLGFNPDRVLTMRLALPAAQYDTPAKVIEFYDRLLQDVRATPGVESAGLLRLLPLATSIGDWGLTIEGYTPPPGVSTPGDWQVATAGGPESLGERLVAGRWLAETDREGAEDVALINEAMAKKYWPGTDPLGRRMRQGQVDRPWITIVGIVADVRHNGITAEGEAEVLSGVRAVASIVRQPDAQHDAHRQSQERSRRACKHGARQDPPARRRPSHRRDSDDGRSCRTIDRHAEAYRAICSPRLHCSVWRSRRSAFTVCSRMSSASGGRKSACEWRLARRPATFLDRSCGRVSATRRSAQLLAVAGAAATSRLLGDLLHDVGPLDPVTFIATPLLLMTIAVLASLIPGWRATRVDPVKAMNS
jgi:hypothetical protein